MRQCTYINRFFANVSLTFEDSTTDNKDDQN